MARSEAPPFQRGQTWFGVDGVINTADPTFFNNSNLEGKEWIFEDIIPIGNTTATGGPTYTALLRSGAMVTCRVVRNVSGINLLPKRLANMQIAGTDGRFALGRVDGYAVILAQRSFPIDEFLPAVGVRNNDLFYVVTKGPALVTTDNSAASLAININVGDQVNAGTFASSTAVTTGGMVVPFQINAGTTANSTNADYIRNAIGRALSAATTGQTGVPLLIDVGHW